MNFSENLLQDHGENINPNFALGLSVTLLVVALGSFMFVMKKQKSKKCSCNVATVLCFVAPLVCCLAGGIFLLYSTSLKERNAQDYEGLMRITDVNYVQRKEVKQENDADGPSTTKYHHYYEAVFNVNWGYEWACPDHGAPACVSSIVPCSEKVCETLSRIGTCRDVELARATAKVQKCSENYLNGTAFDSSLYTLYVAVDGPSSDSSWPSIVAFGDCDSCDATFSVASPSSLKAMRSSAITVLMIGLVLVGVLVVLERNGTE